MEVVTGATSSLLPKLGSFLQEEYKLQYKVRRDIQSLQKELLFMNATLLMVAEEPADKINPLLRTWATLIRELSYDMEDVVNTFLAEVHGNGTTRLHLGGLREKAFNMLCMCTTHHRLADMIEEMKSLTKELTELRARYRLDDIQTMGVQPQPQRGESLIAGFLNGSSCSSNSGAGAHRAGAYGIAEEDLMVSRQLIRMDNPVGGKTDMEKLRHWLVRDDKAHFDEAAVLSITGFSGVGKTTIATSLYQDLGNHFDCRAAVIVSQNYEEDEVLRNILRQIKPHRILQRQQGSGSIDWTHLETMNRDELVLELKTSLSEKRYILLIDDIRSAYTWNCIRNCLPDDNRKGSRVILTTIFQAIGATCSQRDGIDCHHPVDFLCDDESKRLFDRIVSESKSSKYSEKDLDQVSEEVCKICRGLPLAIVTMAGLVASNPLTPIKKWKDVCKSLFPESVPSLTLDGVTRILEYCYNDLPADLRTCSLYLSIFPKGSKISRKRLTRRLIAEGFVSEKHGLSDEEVAETYFNQLIKRKIIRPVEHSSNGKVKSFQVHDMVLEYIVSKSSEENFITVVGGQWLMPTPTKIRRLSVQSSDSMHGNSTKHMNLSQVRSLTMFRNLDQLNFRSFNNGILQVLDLEGCKGLKEKHLKDMCKILVLKYLSLRRTDIYKLPSNIEKLEYLETLDLRETDVGELPKSAGQLKRIINIFGGNKNPRKGLKLTQEINKETMKALRILSGIEIDDQSSGVAGLHQLTGLRKLAIYKLIILKDSEVFKQLGSAIEYLGSCGLQTLAVNDEGSDFINSLDSMSTPPRYLSALELYGNLKKLPQWITGLSNLNKLTLSVTVLRMYTFKFLCDLPLLFSLTFSLSAAKQDEAIEDILEKNKSESGGEIFVPSGGFKSLKLLRFFAPLVPMLNFPEDAMPALERIEMQFEAFEGLFGIDTLESLKEVHLRVNTSADEITNFIVEDLKAIKKPKIIVDHVITS